MSGAGCSETASISDADGSDAVSFSDTDSVAKQEKTGCNSRQTSNNAARHLIFFINILQTARKGLPRGTEL